MVFWQNIEVPIWGGIDSKTDPKSIAPNKLEVVENGTLQNPGAIHKRTGATKLASSVIPRNNDQGVIPTISAINEAHAAGSTMVVSANLTNAFDGYDAVSRALGYSTQSAQWTDIGRLQNVEYTTDLISSTSQGLLRVQVAYIGTIAAYTWEVEDDTAGTQQIYLLIKDTATDTIITPETNVTAFAGVNGIKPRVAAVNDAFFVFVYQDNTAGNVINWLQIDPTNPNASLDDHAGSITLGSSLCWDLQAIPHDQAILAYAGSILSNIVVVGWTVLGSPTALHTLAKTPKTAISLNHIREAPEAGRYDLILAYQDSSTNDIVGIGIELGVSPATLDTATIFQSGFSSSLIIGFTCGREPSYETSTSDVIRFFVEAPSAGADYLANQHTIYTRCSNSDGSLQGYYWDEFLKVGLYSKPFNYNNQLFIQLVTQGHTTTTNDLNTYYLWCPTTRSIGAPTDPNYISGGFVTFAPDAVVWRGDAYGYQAGGYLSSAEPTGTQSFTIGAPKAAVLDSDNILEYQCGAITYTFDQAGYSCAKLGQNLYTAGGVVQIHDGLLQEDGFFQDPDDLNLTGGSGGSMSDGTYTYVCIYEWTDRKGQIQRSAPSPQVSITLSGGTSSQSVAVKVPTLTILGEWKQGKGTNTFRNITGEVVIKIFRTIDNGATFHDIGQRVSNNIAQLYVSATDKLSDAELEDNQIIYYQSSSTNSDLLNEPAPATKILVGNESRLFAVPMEDRKSIAYSQPWNTGTAISWSSNLVVPLADLQYDISALAVLDDKLVVFTPYEIRMLDATAFDGGSQQEIQIPTDVGAIDQRSIVVCQLGVLFKSHKGLYLLDRGLGTTYIGADVEQYNNEDIVSATLMPALNQIRFITSSGVALVLDYYIDPNTKPSYTWAVYTNYNALDAHNWNGTYTRFRSDGLVLQDDTTRYNDDDLDGYASYNLRVKTGWLKPSGFQGYARTRRAAVLGERHTDGYMTIDVSRDYKSAVEQEIVFDTTQTMAVDDELCQHKFRLKNQNCEAVQLDITVEPNGGTEQSLSLTNLALEIGVKKGIRRLPNAKIK